MRAVVLDVGQCDMDHTSIRRVVEQLGAKVLRASGAVDAKRIINTESIDLVLVNRIFDCDGGDGISLIREITQLSGKKPAVMLVSNYEEYQDQAVQLGALRGFGKAELRNPKTVALLGSVLPEA